MLFNSATYLFLFLPIVVILYWQLPLRGRQVLILLSSLLFYGFWRVDFIPLLLFSALLDYFIALAIERREGDERTRKRLLIFNIVANLTILCIFKYLAFFVDSGASVARLLGYEPSFVELNIILPLGISFYIFQTMSYTIDVYRRQFKAERDVVAYCSYVTFFPQLVAGPILRAAELIPELKTRQRFDYEDLRIGLERIIAGLIMKMVIADTVAGFVDVSFERDIASLSALDAWTLAFLFGFQIYFDFAGYSSIAIGSARILGFKIPENFNFPYVASSPRDFWQRWHISLSSWISDYLYKPIIGVRIKSTAERGRVLPDRVEKRIGDGRRTWGLYLTWGIMGLWHGAAWTFVLWGLFHAFVIHMHRLVSKAVRLPAGRFIWLMSVGITLPIMMAGWIPFRAESLADSFRLWGHMLDPTRYGALTLSPNSYFIAAALTVGVLLRYLWVTGPVGRWMETSRSATPLTVAYHALLFALVLLFLQVKASFIYFQF